MKNPAAFRVQRDFLMKKRTLKDELCAEMMLAVFFQKKYAAAEALVAEDAEVAGSLKRVLESIQEHLAEEYE